MSTPAGQKGSCEETGDPTRTGPRPDGVETLTGPSRHLGRVIGVRRWAEGSPSPRDPERTDTEVCELREKNERVWGLHEPLLQVRRRPRPPVRHLPVRHETHTPRRGRGVRRDTRAQTPRDREREGGSTGLDHRGPGEFHVDHVMSREIRKGHPDPTVGTDPRGGSFCHVPSVSPCPGTSVPTSLRSPPIRVGTLVSSLPRCQ